MKWEQVRNTHPGKWVLFEAIEAYSTDGKRVVDDLLVLDSYHNSKDALHDYKNYHKKEPHRELYVAHTDKEELDIIERKWLGIRV